MSNKYSDQLMQALDIAIDEKISTLQFDKTIQATVQSVVDLDTGEYRVKYKDGIISAFAADPKETFKQGDAVYVTVPESDFSNKKFISHRITNNSLSTGQYTELANTIFEVSPNFSDLGYTYTSQPSNGYSLIVGRNSSLNILQSAPALANSRFKAYADQYEYIQISASFYNEFTTDHEVGDYGIQLVLTNLDDKQVSYFLNLNDFNGDPYHLATWSPQSTVVKIPKGQIKALNAIYFYENGFISEGNKANLFMSDFSLNFVDKVDLTEVPYYLNILPLDGIAFTTSQASLRLEGHVYHIGEELPETSCIFQWFERDLSVVPGDEAYDKRAGWGWRPIEEATNKLLTRTKTQVPWQKSYKLVVVYNSTTLMTKEITLINGSLDIEIEQVTSGNAIYLKLTKSGYTGDWYYLANDGNQVAIPQSPRSGTSPDIVPYLLYSPMTFYCQVYQGNIYQGELTYVMQNIESKDDVSVVFSGESLFSYDANGDINIYDAELERSLRAEIVWKKGIISSSPTIRWLDFENNVIGSDWVDYSNKDSMLKKVRVDTTENILYYTVKHKFKQTSSKNNSFRVEISTTDGQVYSFDKEIIFTKTGDPGTNGTRYQSLITVTSTNKFVGVSNNNTSVTLGCKIYKDQTEFSGANISWTPVNLAIVSQSGAAVSVRANNSNQKRYMKATITIVDEGKTTTLYDFYPVNSCTSQPNIDLSELPKYIQYASNGRNPQFRKQVPVIKYNGATATIASGDTGVIKIANGQFKPIDEFNPDNSIGLLTVTVSGLTVYHPVPMYINTFGNEAINGWDGVSVDVDTAGGKILAPQVGAGTKDQSTNKFTGVVMGRDSAQQKIGLYGYQAGVNSFGLTEEGIAYFGVAGKGRITIDGTSATISGGGGGTSTSGMTITLSAAASSADAIRVGNGNFIVTYGGKLTAKSAVIDGTITAGAGSVIGGWTLQQNRLYSGSGAAYVALDSGTANVNETIWAGKADSATAPFRVTRAGALTATSADITGTIKANTGYIGGTSGWTIDSNRIYGAKSGKYVALSTQGNYALFAGASANTDTAAANAPFWVKFDGSLQATAATIQGTITANSGAIGNWKINSSSDGALRSTLSDSGASTRIYLNGKPSSGGNVIEVKTSASSIVDNQVVATNGQFYVTDQGKMVATNAEIHGTIKSKAGELGGWTINSDGLKKADDIYIYSNGSMKLRSNFAIDTSGNVTVKGNITATAGYIGWQNDSNKGWAITANRIYSNATNYVALASNGTYAIWAGNSTASSAPFSVTHAGKVIATDIEAIGKITANTGKIAGWVINGNKLQVRTSATDTTGSANLYLNGGPWANGESQYVIYMSASSPSDTGASNTNGRFYVTSSGHMFAQSAEIRGTITSKAGSIGTWNISNRAISTLANETTAANSTTGMARSGFNGYIQVDGKNYSQTEAANRISNIAFWGGMNYVKEGENYYLQGSETGTFFAVTHGGILYCRKANIRGTIIADSGTIGGWEIRNNRLQNSDGSVYLSASSGLKLGENFSVSSSGALSASGATISGNITASQGWIGNWKIDNNRLQSANGDVYLGTNGFKLGSNFSVNNQGQLNAKGATISGNITLGSGSIINWNNVTEQGTVPYDEAGDAAAALRSAKDYTDDEISSLDIPVLPSYIKSTKIYEARIESPTIIGGDIYAANFYAVETDPNKYLQITNTGIYYHTNTFGKWELTSSPASENASGWNEVQIVSPEAGMEIATYGPITLDTAQSINLTTSYRIKLDASQGVYIGSTSLAQYIEDHAGTAKFG